MVPNCVIIVAGTEHEGVWLEFSPDDAIALAQGIIDAAEHAKGGAGVSADYWTPDEEFAHIPTPPGAKRVGPWQYDSQPQAPVPNRWIRFVILDEWQFDAPTACPCCPDEGRVTLDCVQNSCGSIQTVGISVDVGSLTAAGAKLLALALDGAANVLHTFKKQITPCNCGCITYIGECER